LPASPDLTPAAFAGLIENLTAVMGTVTGPLATCPVPPEPAGGPRLQSGYRQSGPGTAVFTLRATTLPRPGGLPAGTPVPM